MLTVIVLFHLVLLFPDGRLPRDPVARTRHNKRDFPPTITEVQATYPADLA